MTTENPVSLERQEGPWAKLKHTLGRLATLASGTERHNAKEVRIRNALDAAACQTNAHKSRTGALARVLLSVHNRLIGDIDHPLIQVDAPADYEKYNGVAHRTAQWSPDFRALERNPYPLTQQSATGLFLDRRTMVDLRNGSSSDLIMLTINTRGFVDTYSGVLDEFGHETFTVTRMHVDKRGDIETVKGLHPKANELQDVFDFVDQVYYDTVHPNGNDSFSEHYES